MRKTSGFLPDSILYSVHRPVFFTSAGLIIAFSIYGGGFSEQAGAAFMVVQDWLVTHLGWFYTAVVAVFFLFIIFLAFSRFAHIHLGPDDALPDYSYVSWIAMLFMCYGLYQGLLGEENPGRQRS